MRLLGVDTGRLSGLKNELVLSGLKNELVCSFELAADVAGSGIREFVNNAYGPAFLERELIGFGVDGYWSLFSSLSHSYKDINRHVSDRYSNTYNFTKLCILFTDLQKKCCMCWAPFWAVYKEDAVV